MNATEQAIAYIKLGWCPVPLPPRSKRPVLDDWPNLRVTVETAAEHFNGSNNIGLLLGDVSGGLVDIDLDHDAAIRLAPHFLPSTIMFGRRSRPRSHYLYLARGARVEKFQAPEGRMLVELRANSAGGLQTMAPGSVHPSGELVEWDADTDQELPTQLKPEQLRGQVARLAAATLLVSSGWSEERAAVFAKAPSPGALLGTPKPIADRITRWLGLAQLRTAEPTSSDKLKRASAYLARIPGAVSGSGGHQQAWSAALTIVCGFDLSESDAYQLLAREYNPRCSPPWSERELEHKVKDAANARAERGWLLRESHPGADRNRQPITSQGGYEPAPKQEEQKQGRPLVRTVAEVLRSDDFKRPRTTTPTGIAEFDQLISGGFKSRQLVVFAAPTGKGKTGLVGTIAYLLACTGAPILWVTTELDDNEQAARLGSIACRSTGLSNATPDDFLSHRISSEVAAEPFDGKPLCLVNLDDPDTDQLALVRESVADVQTRFGRMPIIVIDYLQVLAPEDPDRRRMSVSRVASALRRMSRDLDTTVVAISSVSRAYYGKKDKKAAEQDAEEDPRDWIAAAKESGDIEYACSVFGYLDTSNEINQLGESEARLIVAKSRAGVPGFVGLRFHGPSGLFVPDGQSTARTQPVKRKKLPDTELVIAYLEKHKRNPPTKETLRTAIDGVGVSRVEAAVKALASEGVIEFEDSTYQNARGQTRTKTVVVLVKAED